MRADLHTHSRFSDGTQTPAELVAEAAAVDLDVIALTDHDTTRGWPDAVEAAQRAGVGLVRGMEVSCRWDGISVHILCYLHDPVGAEITHTVEQARHDRLTRSRIMVERLAEDFPITWEDVQRIAGPDATIGRPHIADALVAAGVVEDRSEAFVRLLAGSGPYYVALPVVSPVEAIGMIHDAGGAAVFAHPLAAARGRVVPDAGMRAIIAAGLDGLEIDHRDNPPAGRERLRVLAARHDLLTTGSSDYHGTGKPNRLGEHTTERSQLAALLDRTTGAEPIGID
ncbi:MAG TPA: PHP domain-containing protein [Brevibacterium senegalense]|uniref:PHP domain-containing protein n=1 Tax=Brevibacterium senegalense TaxID=1033736 RepID=A0A921SMI6_9MICO|nr:PHP domain-containing protein [Brevibacterium senegalense]